MHKGAGFLSVLSLRLNLQTLMQSSRCWQDGLQGRGRYLDNPLLLYPDCRRQQ